MVAECPCCSAAHSLNTAGTFLLDLTEQKRAQEGLRASERSLRQAQAELAHVNRVTTMGQLAASISHEVTQPIAAGITNAKTALRWLDSQPPDLEEVRLALGGIVNEGNRATDVIDRIRALIQESASTERSAGDQRSVL